MDKQKNGMVSRRDFLQSTVAVSAFALAANPSRAAFPSHAPGAERDETSHGPSAFVVDSNLPLSPDFVMLTKRFGLPLKVIDSDPAGIWMHDIEPGLRHRSTAIAGFTSEATLFCLQFLARDHGLDLVYRIAHLFSPGGRYEHVLDGTPTLDNRSYLRLAASGGSWPATVVSMAASWREGICAPRDAELIALSAQTPHTRGLGVSWLMAPRDGHQGRRG